MRKLETHDWWPRLVELKDELSLRELAERFDVTPGAISAALKRNGIPRKPAPPGPRSRRSQALPPEPGEAPKASTKRKKGTKGKKKGTRGGRSKAYLIEPYADLLGQRPDGEIAKRAGVNPRTVANYRMQRGIAGYSGPKRRGKDRKPRKSRIDPFQHLLGKVPDRVVAEKAGVSINAVRNYRVKRGIPARGPGRPKAGTVPAPGAVKAESGSGAIAWKVLLERGDTVVVVASDLGAAAARAAAVGPVQALERVGPVV